MGRVQYPVPKPAAQTPARGVELAAELGVLPEGASAGCHQLRDREHPEILVDERGRTIFIGHES